MRKAIILFIICFLTFALAVVPSRVLKDIPSRIFAETHSEDSGGFSNTSSMGELSIGTNLHRIAQWSTERPFVDIFKSSRQWLTQCTAKDPGCSNAWNTGEYEQLNLDAGGWIRSLPTPEDPLEYTLVGTVLNRDLGGYPGGRYVVLYDGEGTLEYQFDAEKDRAASVPGRDVIDVTPSNAGIWIGITATDPQRTGNYLRNIRVVPADSSEREIFNPEFLNKLKHYKALRFMDWMGTNSSEQKEWHNRPTVTSYSYNFQNGGVPLEIMIDLANRIGSAPWFNMPHMATDAYMKNFAEMVRENLSQDLPIYVEYSNEVWNQEFIQGDWIEQQGIAEWSDSSAGNTKKRLNWHGKRTAQMCDIWKEVFNSEQDRVICVMGTQAANSWTALQALDCPLWQEGPCQQHGIDALAIAPYFGGYLGSKQYESQVQDWTVTQLFEEINNGGVLAPASDGALQTAFSWMQENAQIAKQRNLKLIAYEGGQHLVGHGGVENNQVIADLFIEANRDPRMYDVYLNYLKQWENVGGDLLLHYLAISLPNKWGSWGALEDVDQESSPKYRALEAFANQNP